MPELIDKTKSICPVCLKVIDADIVENDDKVLITKICSNHGSFEDIYWSDYEMFNKAKRFHIDGSKLQNPHTESRDGCPNDCGLCSGHLTPTVLCNIDVTNRCNIKCPICFANAEATGYVLEPSMEELIVMMKSVREEKPMPCLAVQFAGGEPTVRDDLPQIIQKAKELGFIIVLVATNGVRIAKDLDFCKELIKDGMDIVYLQFDGINEKPYITARGFNALPIKLQALNNFRKADFPNIVLVPTLVKGINDDQAGDIIYFGAKNIDIVRGINFQPISFSGRVNKEELEKMRITIPDFIKIVEEQTNGEILAKDFYPVTSVSSFSNFVEAWRKAPQVKFSCHEHCGVATYVIIEDNGELTPITQLINFDDFFGFMDDLTKILENNGGKITKAKVIAEIAKELPRTIERRSEHLDIKKLIWDIFRKGNLQALTKFSYRSLLIGCMHFQDAYNFDVERLKRCAIHYAVPGGKVIPFCTYNSLYREKIEKQYAIPLYIWEKNNRKINTFKKESINVINS